jgi:F-type H+-transporting ATPase subunit delta
MTDMTVMARPYALAAFEYALKKNAVSSWEGMLSSAALAARETALSGWLSSPLLTKARAMDLFCHVLASVLNQEQKNFICLLVEYKRIQALPDIAKLFAYYRSEHEKNMTVYVVSAELLDETWQKKLAAGLSKRLQRQISLQCEVDPDLIGGAMIRAGDRVIDGSIRGQLNRLLETL